jgi:N-acetylmuramoyl-L-alanine amidase
VNLLPLDVSDTDILVGALTVYGEARGDTQEGRTAVAHTIINRCRARSWYGKGNGEDLQDHTLSAVCLKPMQFSCWNENDPNRNTLSVFKNKGLARCIGSKDFRACLKALIDALDGFTADPTKGATHYLTIALHNSGKAPAWSIGDYIEIGAHRFFKGVK